MVFLISLQKKVEPYKLKENNEIELLGMIVGTITMYAGFIFAQGNEVEDGFHTLATIIVFLCNSFFIIKWTYLLLMSFEWKNEYYQRFLKMLSILLRKEYTPFVSSQNSKSKDEVQEKGKAKKVIKGKRSKNSSKDWRNLHFSWSSFKNYYIFRRITIHFLP